MVAAREKTELRKQICEFLRDLEELDQNPVFERFAAQAKPAIERKIAKLREQLKHISEEEADENCM